MQNKRTQVIGRLGIAAVLTIVLGVTTVNPARAANDTIAIKAFSVKQVSGTGGPIVAMAGSFRTAASPSEVHLDLVTFGPIGTRSELTQIIKNPNLNQGTIANDISVTLKSPSANTNIKWSLKFRGDSALGSAQPGVYVFGLVERGTSVQTNVVAPWFYANKNLKPTKIIFLPQVAVQNFHLADGSMASLNSDARTLARLNNLIDDTVQNVTWIKDAAVDSWITELGATALKPASDQVKAKIDAISSHSQPEVYGTANLQALVASVPSVADQALKLSTASAGTAVLYLPKTGTINAQALGQLVTMHKITPIVSNEFVSGDALQTTNAIANIRGEAGIVYDAGSSDCFALGSSFEVNQCLLGQVAMITAESPNQSRTVAIVPPAMWSPDAGQIRAIVAEINKSGVGELTSLAAAQKASGDPASYFPDAPSGEVSTALINQGKLISQKSEVLGNAFSSQEFIASYTRAQIRNYTDSYTDPASAYRMNKRNLIGLATVRASISIQSSKRISIASSHSEIPLTIVNHSRFPLTVRAMLSSLSSSRLTSVPTDLVTVQVGQRLTVPIEIVFTGIGQVEVMVSLENSAGQDLGLGQKISIASSGYQSLARTLVWGACGMLVLFAIVNAARKRRGGDSPEPLDTPDS